MQREEIIQLARHHLNDLDGEVFSDKELNRFLDDAAREYFTDTASARMDVPILLDDGRFELPNHALAALRGWDDVGMNLLLGTSDDVDRLDCKREHVEMVYEDLSDDGVFRVSPNVEQAKWRTTENTSGYGVVTQLYGIACGYDYGTNIDAFFFRHVGSMQYAREGEVDEIQDHLALVYGVCAKAFSTDADLAHTQKAGFYEQLYRQRVSGRSIVTRTDAHAPRRGEYF